MAIPGTKPKIEATAKVRIGEKKTSKGGKEYPASTDYFVSTSFPGKPNELTISFVHPGVEDAFSTGLEWWQAKEGRNYLACYTKDDGDNPVALRLDKMLDPGQEPVGPPRGNGRLPILCPARECPHLKSKKCKPMGRLVFQIVEGDTGAEKDATVYQLDTKSWNSVERLTGALQVAASGGPLNTPGRRFVLSVSYVQKGGDRFPVLSLREEFSGDTGRTLEIATVLCVLEQTEGDARAKLIAALRAVGRDPASPKVVAWVQEKGVEKALAILAGQG